MSAREANRTALCRLDESLQTQRRLHVIWIGGVIAVTASVAIWAWKVSPLLIIIPITVGGAALYILSALVGAVEHGAAESIYSDDELERYIEERMK